MRPFLAGVLVLAACSVDSDNASDELETWTVGSTPSLEITGNDEAGEPRLGHAEGVSRLADGGVVVADRGLSSLRYFSSSGEFLREVGREGDGPGEFRYIANMHRCGDSLFVHDISRGEPYQVYSPDGSLGRSLAFAIEQSKMPYRSACNRNGMFLHMGWDWNASANGRTRGVTPFWITDQAGKLHASLGEFPGSERLVMQGSTIPHPLGRETVLALSSERAYIGTADSFAVLSFALDGTPGAVLRHPDTDARTTPDDIERFKFLDTTGQNAVMKQALVRMWEGVEYPPTVPAYDQMIVDVHEQLWVRRTPRRTGGTAEWIVFGPDGAPSARVTMSGELRVHEIGDDYVLGIAVDPTEGSQSVQLFSLTRGR